MMSYKINSFKAYGLAAAFIALSAAAPSAFADDRKAYDLTGFDGIKASAGINVAFERADSYSIIADFKNADADDIKIRMDGDVLKISYANSKGPRNRKIKVTVTGPNLDFASVASGAYLSIGGLNAADIKIRASSGGSLKISGSCQAANIGVSSGGSISAKTLKCKSVNARASSGGSLSAYAADFGKGKSGSGGSIRIHGDPDQQEKNKSISGGSVSFP